ncbi:MAG: MbcA/ParS/Xre antitoxin family protein [Elusimicrobiota bacterium]|jgi:DNA-binding transcriptional regulator YiaG
MTTRHDTRSSAREKTANAHTQIRETESAVSEALAALRDAWDYAGQRIAQILHLSPTTVNGWLRNERVPLGHAPYAPDIQALLHLLAIHRSLHAMFSNPKHQVAWLEQKHPDFGMPPVDKIAESIEGLVLVRQYLDYARGRGA